MLIISFPFAATIISELFCVHPGTEKINKFPQADKKCPSIQKTCPKQGSQKYDLAEGCPTSTKQLGW